MDSSLAFYTTVPDFERVDGDDETSDPSFSCLMRDGAPLPAAGLQLSPYLSFNGKCEAAFQLYERSLGAKLGAIFRYAGSPMASQLPADWQDKVMHGSLTIGRELVMGGDVAPDRYEEPKGFSLSLQITSPADAERMFRDLAQDGRVVMPLEKTFWAVRFGVVVDRFGIQRLINCETSGGEP